MSDAAIDGTCGFAQSGHCAGCVVSAARAGYASVAELAEIVAAPASHRSACQDGASVEPASTYVVNARCPPADCQSRRGCTDEFVGVGDKQRGFVVARRRIGGDSAQGDDVVPGQMITGRLTERRGGPSWRTAG